MKQRRRQVKPDANLIGYSGKVKWDGRLLPLRMTRKYKNFLKQEKSDKHEKISQLSQLIRKYQNLSSVINNLKSENKNHENSDLLLELQREKARYQKHLLFLKSKLDQLPDTLKTSMQEIFSRNTKHPNQNHRPPKRKKGYTFQNADSYTNKECAQTGQNCKQSSSNLLPKKDHSERFDILKKSTSRSAYGSVKSQILAKDRFSNLRPISIDLFSNGDNLLQVLAKEFGEEVDSCFVTFGTKKVERKKTLYEQGIYHGSTVNLSLKLHGGTKSKKKNKKKKECNTSVNKVSCASGNPESWTKDRVKSWFDNECKDYDIDVEKVSQFASINGKGLNKLKKEQWSRQLPGSIGELLFDRWNDLKKEIPNELSSGTDAKNEEKPELQSVVSTHSEMLRHLHVPTRQKICRSLNVPRSLGGDYKTLAGLIGKLYNDDICIIGTKPNPAEELLLWWDPYSSATVHKFRELLLHKDMRREDLVDILDKRSLPAVHPEEKRPASETASEERESIDEKSPEVFREDVNNSMTRGPFGKVDNLKEMADAIPLYGLPTPKSGTVIAVSGTCRKKPEREGEIVTFLLADDPPGAASSFDQVKIDVRTKGGEDFNARTVEGVLKKINTGTPVAVRGRVKKLDHGCVTDAAATYETLGFKLVIDVDQHGLVYEEKSTGVPSKFGIYPCVVDDKTLDVGGIITKTIERIFCNSTVPDGEIKKIAIALKNRHGGDIFVGVENGKVTGMEFTEADAVKWRKQISVVIEQILPESKEKLSICSSEEEARECAGEKSFVSVMKLGGSAVRPASDKVRVVGRIHVTKGTKRVYFSKQSVHAYVRVGAETKRITDYIELFSRLDSLCSRTIQPILDEDSYIEQQSKEAFEKMGASDSDACPRATLQKKYKVFNVVKLDRQKDECKMIFGNKPVEMIATRHLAMYTCGFLNSLGGRILYGVQAEEQSKIGHVVGIVIPSEDRKELVTKSVTALSKVYPPVKSSQFRIKFYDVTVSSGHIVKYPETSAHSGNCVILRGPAEEIGTQWPKFVKDMSPGTHSSVIRVESQCCCIVVEKPNWSSEEFMKAVQLFAEKIPKVNLDTMEERKLKPILESACVVDIEVYRSPYPIHMIKPIETSIVDGHGEVNSFDQVELLKRFELDSRSGFDVENFLNHVYHFDPAGNSYLLIASPFDLGKFERDLYGLVIPEWTLTIDFDQDLKQEGHLYQIFEDLNDLHQTERNRFVRTPQSHKLDLNPKNGVCWLAARGYREIAASLSQEGHGKWNMTHRTALRSLLEAELTSCVKPNQLNIVVLWDENHHKTVNSLRTILEDILSICSRTTITFVCSTLEAKSDIRDNLFKPLQENYCDIMVADRIYVAPPYILAQHLSRELAEPYRSEDNYQVPHKIVNRRVAQIVLETLPQRLRQNIHGHLKMMYCTRERKPTETALNNQRKKFYSGSEITDLGLRGEIGIKRSKMTALEKEFKALSSDKKSHVSLILVKADRGAGTTTMCLQFLFKHHKEYPCAQLIEIRDGLASYIDDVNKATKLPLLLLVDEEIAHLQEFLDLKKEVEARNINVIFLLIEPAEFFSGKQPSSPRKPGNPRIKSERDNSLYGPSPHKVVELKRVLDVKEAEELTNQLVAIAADEGKRAKLLKQYDRSVHKEALRTFVHFSLTAFGHEFTGLTKYVQLGLALADEKQKTILAFLALTHVFTDSSFPASAFAGFLEKKRVVLEAEFETSYLREFLSPPVDESDSRRISFLEVAKKILELLAEEAKLEYWSFIKDVSVKMAKVVLSDNIRTKKIDRLSRKLFVTSEYESEKFSSLIRSMKEDNPDMARDTLIELVEDVFQKHTSFRAHLLAHLAKYYMTVCENFTEAKPRIKEAIKDQEDDVLLHHIHGDIIRLHVQALKDDSNVDLDAIVACAIESSGIFEFVRNKRPHMSHGYVSDAMVRITVMQAARKKMDGKDASFIDYLIQMIDDVKEKGEKISKNQRYLLSLIPDAHQYLEDSVIDFEHKEGWKKKFTKCIGKLGNLKRLYEKLRDDKDSIRGCTAVWLREITVETQVLYNALEIEMGGLSQEEIEKRIKGIEECNLQSITGERTMRFWIRHSRLGKSVPPLEKINKYVKRWSMKSKKRGGISPHAEFYNYVVNVLIALKDPKDREKMELAVKLVKRQQGKKYNKKEEVTLPLEWLHCKDGGHDIKSIDSLLNHDDLVKEAKKFSQGQGKRRPGREVIEGSLFEKQVTKWEGIVKEIRNDWHGTIVFKDHLEVRFVPVNVQPSMPTTGETVRFCLAFDRHGLSAWSVVRAVERNQLKKFTEIAISDGEEEDSDNGDEKEDSENATMVPPSLFLSEMPEVRREIWDDYHGERMQGVVVSINIEKGFGFLKHPDVTDELFFHASQLINPVKSLEGTIEKFMILKFTVEKLSDRTRAANIRVLKEEDASQDFQDFVARLREKKYSPASSTRRENEPSTPVGNNETPYREERHDHKGTIIKFLQENLYGFIKPDRNHRGITKIFFHRNNLANKGTQLKIGDRVQFRITQGKKGLEANDIFVQSNAKKVWPSFIDRGIQEGWVSGTTDTGGFIKNHAVTEEGKTNLYFYNQDIVNANPSQVTIGSKVHFEVKKRGGRCVAVKINVMIAAPESLVS